MSVHHLHKTDFICLIFHLVLRCCRCFFLFLGIYSYYLLCVLLITCFHWLFIAFPFIFICSFTENENENENDALILFYFTFFFSVASVQRVFFYHSFARLRGGALFSCFHFSLIQLLFVELQAHKKKSTC